MRVAALLREAHRTEVAKKAATVAYRRVRRGSLRAANQMPSDLTLEVVQAIAVEFYQPYWSGHREALSFGKLARKLKDMIKFFVQKGKAAWAKFKEILGVEKITQLRPSHIKDLAKRGWELLKKAVGKAFSVWPLKIYTLPEAKLFSVNGLLGKLMERFPRFKGWLEQKVRPKVDQLDTWLRKYLPGVTHVALVAIFIWIWLNVVEFEWDISALTDVLMGRLTLGDLLTSIPGSALGALMNGLGLGTFTLLPAAFAARAIFLMANRLLKPNLELDEKKIQEQFG